MLRLTAHMHWMSVMSSTGPLSCCWGLLDLCREVGTEIFPDSQKDSRGYRPTHCCEAPVSDGTLTLTLHSFQFNSTNITYI